MERDDGACAYILGTLRNATATSKGNRDIISHTTTPHVHHGFFVHFFVVPARLRLEMTKFLSFFLRGGNGKAINSTISVWTRAPLFSSNINSPLFSNWSTWDNREMVWKHAECFCQRPVNERRRCRIVRSLLLVLGPQRPYIPRILKPDLHILFTITGFFGPLQATVGRMTQERLSKLPIPPP